ncbi:MAG: N-acetylglucosamine-6-phosphate deacetylase [Pseudomonadota bacterium]
MSITATVGADIFDGDVLHCGRALLQDGALFAGIVEVAQIPRDAAMRRVDGGTVTPGFVDLQVNGGGGVMFNDDPRVATLRTIAEAHRRTGTRALLPTLITDTPGCTTAAVEAAVAAIDEGVPGIVGIHLEGPHLSKGRKGAHDAALIRPMEAADETMLLSAAERLPNVMITVAPESVRLDQIARLAGAGITVSLGHTDCTFEEASAAFQAGARCVTHLFNAMSQLTNREPGLVGAALHHGVGSGLIADAIHVHPATMRAALAAKRAPSGMFLVTDAMATAGSDLAEFSLNGRRVLRRDGRLTLEDGTLAGADLAMGTAIGVVEGLGVDRAQALAMATSVPASFLRNPASHGRFRLGQPANAVLIEGAATAGTGARIAPLEA